MLNWIVIVDSDCVLYSFIIIRMVVFRSWKQVNIDGDLIILYNWKGSKIHASPKTLTSPLLNYEFFTFYLMIGIVCITSLLRYKNEIFNKVFENDYN